ncbi:exopolysaccharide biosynthesis protein [Paracoccus sp. S3-43]|uniref:exopolysaccharide biosynthesis protein n=1 Tax=Paracoccus sp. S3-43 TaxID=3030011 RepID=UPI0023AF1C6B|nr:exopolysaccharide biosynthesis protein [Paracoccus sp. S3-43]WEF26043.1 exopolysaccharide biosynthesis protein [Paracoccus sp. S3-43]
MPFLERVPFTSSLLGATVRLLAFGMLARDGLFTVLGLAVRPCMAITPDDLSAASPRGPPCRKEPISSRS